ncbi:MAG: HIT family protein [Parcubacteria group bacterium]|nr:HIT family protein [Parcubacteria group bacterium]
MFRAAKISCTKSGNSLSAFRTVSLGFFRTVYALDLVMCLDYTALMEECIFCKIVRDELPSYKVYENETVLAFMDIHPIRPGHLLVVPKVHEPNFEKLPIEVYMHVMQATHILAGAIKNALKPKKMGLVIAGWDVPHTHVHLIPTEDHEDITSKILLEGKEGNPSSETLTTIAEKIAAKIKDSL